MNNDKYRELFIVEGEAHIVALSQSVVRLEHMGSGNEELINDIFRSLHSMKGMAASMGYDELSLLCHRLEELASDARDQRMSISRELVDLWLSATDAFSLFVRAVRERLPLPSLAALLERSSAFSLSRQPPPAGPSHTASRLPARAMPMRLPVPEPLTTVRVKTGVLDELLDAADELVVAEARLTGNDEQPRARLRAAVRTVHDRVMALRMVSFATVAERYPRVVRDAARSTGKWVELEITGASVELDRVLLEAVDPVLLHLLLNAVDHGIEPSDERAKKNSIGRITLSVEKNRQGTLISVGDDGAGIDTHKLREEADRRGVLVPKGELSSEALIDLLASPGFSTKSNVTSMSGRGVGMDVVRTTIDGLGGSVSVSTSVGKSTVFSLHLPPSLALFSVMRIEHGGALYGLPLAKVAATTTMAPVALNRVKIKDRVLPFHTLDALLGVKAVEEARWLAVIKDERQDFAVPLEQIVDVVDVVVKKLGPPLSEMPLIEGAAILPDGRPLLVLNLAAVVH